MVSPFSFKAVSMLSCKYIQIVTLRILRESCQFQSIHTEFLGAIGAEKTEGEHSDVRWCGRFVTDEGFAETRAIIVKDPKKIKK